jgi:hypothetical protein
MIKEYLQRIKERKQKFKDIQDEHNIQKRIIEREKSSNERELEKYLEEDRQKDIKNKLDRYRKQKSHSLFNDSSMLKNNKILFKNEDKYNMMKQKNIFSGGSNVIR